MKKKISILASAASLLLSTSAFGAMITAPVQAHPGFGMNATGASMAAVANSAGGAPPSIDLGLLDGDSSVGSSLAPNEVLWFSFELDGATYLDITTSSADFDTEIGLFSDLGDLLASDDDDGFGLLSTLTFGTGSGLELGDVGNLDGGFATGEDGPLAAGVYYLAIGEFQTTFADGFSVDSSGFDVGGNFVIDFFTDSSAGPVAMSEPASLLLVGFGLVGIAAIRRRRS